ncbi:hypothetical protein P5V15_006247 [Pogonomyrmex californicus]
MASQKINTVINNRPPIETFELLVPFEAFTGFSRWKYHEYFAQIQKSYGLKLKIMNTSFRSLRNEGQAKLVLTGTADQIAPAVVQIENKIKYQVELQAHFKYMISENSKLIALGRSKPKRRNQDRNDHNKDDVNNDNDALSNNNNDSNNSINDSSSDSDSSSNSYSSSDSDNDSIDINVENNCDGEIRDGPIEKYLLLVPYPVCKKIIGKYGYTVEEIEKSTGAKIAVEMDSKKYEQMERKVIVVGNKEQAMKAISQIRDKADELNESMSVILSKKVEDPSKIDFEKELEFKDAELYIRDSAINLHLCDFTIFPKTLLEQVSNSLEVYVSAMETPNRFWIQVIGLGNINLKRLVNSMTAYYNTKKSREIHALKKVVSGQMVAARLKHDKRWFRAEVINFMEESSQCKIFFVDYGNIEIVSINNVLELRTDMLILRQQAVECSLANVKPRGSQWNPEAIDMFAQIAHATKWIPLIAKVRGYKERLICDGGSRRPKTMIPQVELFYQNNDEEINIGDKLVRLGMALVEEEISLAVNSALPREKCDFLFLPYLPDSFHLD